MIITVTPNPSIDRTLVIFATGLFVLGDSGCCDGADDLAPVWGCSTFSPPRPPRDCGVAPERRARQPKTQVDSSPGSDQGWPHKSIGAW